MSKPQIVITFEGEQSILFMLNWNGVAPTESQLIVAGSELLAIGEKLRKVRLDVEHELWAEQYRKLMVEVKTKRPQPSRIGIDEREIQLFGA